MPDPINYDKVDAMVNRLVAAITPPPPVLTPAEDPLALREEYKAVIEIIKLLTDIRFRCIVFVTAMVTAANALGPYTIESSLRPALGLLGLVATLGITVYELRNSQLYEAAGHRAKTLEERLAMKGSSTPSKLVGLFGERPAYEDRRRPKDLQAAISREIVSPVPLMRFWHVPVKHDHGLALIYGAALGAWVYMAVYGLLALPAPVASWGRLNTQWLALISTGAGVAAGVISVASFIAHDKNRLKKPRNRLVSFTQDDLVIRLSDGRESRNPLKKWPDLLDATSDGRDDWKVVEDAKGILWEKLRLTIGINELSPAEKPD